MLTSTAGEVSTDTASAAPVASARTLEGETPPSTRADASGSFSLPAFRGGRRPNPKNRSSIVFLLAIRSPQGVNRAMVVERLNRHRSVAGQDNLASHRY